MKICEHCYEEIEGVRHYDHSFSAPYGSTTAHYEHIESVVVCPNGHESGQYIEVEDEFARRYVRRFGLGCKHFVNELRAV
jgi:hypothetical protein